MYSFQIMYIELLKRSQAPALEGESIPIPIYCDNNGAIALAKNTEFHKRAKHINIVYHYVRQELENRNITTPYIPSDQNLADRFTKPLIGEKHQKFVRSLGLDTPSS